MTYSRTDDGNALRLVDDHRADIRYCPQRGQWLRWDAYRWVWDEAETIRERARSVARNLPTGSNAEYAHQQKSLSSNAVSAMVRLARTDARVIANVGELDAHAFALNTPSGVINLRTGELGHVDRDQLHTRATTVPPDHDQQAPLWQQFLADTFAGDPQLTAYVQRLLGLSLLGTVLEQTMPFAFGAGANGKSTLFGTTQRVLGVGDTGYSISAPAEMLLASANSGHPTDIARLSGARLVIASEIEDGQRFAEARIKQLTGKDVLTGRFMRQDFFSFGPTHTLWLHANHQPQVKAGGHAFWRRIRLLPFLHTVPDAQQRGDLEDRLVEDEGPAVLAWLVDGARDYLTHGLHVPESVTDATAAYERDQDALGRFVAEMCETGPAGQSDMWVEVKELRSTYESWCHLEGEETLNAKALTQGLRSRFGVMPQRDASTRSYAGIRLRVRSADVSWSREDEPWWQR